MRKGLILIIGLFLLFSCSSDEQVGIFDTYPISFIPDKAEIVGSSTYYYTDTIIFKTANLLTEALDSARMSSIISTYFDGDTSRTNFPIKSIQFTDATQAIVTAGQSNQGRFTERSGIGTIETSEPIAFKVNSDLETLITCITITNKRIVDTIQEADFIEGLDTFVNIETELPFQLKVVDTDVMEIGYCNPFNELDQVGEFATRNGLQNNERIVTHRTDLVFKRSNN